MVSSCPCTTWSKSYREGESCLSVFSEGSHRGSRRHLPAMKSFLHTRHRHTISIYTRPMPTAPLPTPSHMTHLQRGLCLLLLCHHLLPTRLASNEAYAYRYSATTSYCSATISHSHDSPSMRLKTPPLLCHYLPTRLTRSKTPPLLCRHLLLLCRHLLLTQLTSSKAHDLSLLCHLHLTQLKAHAYHCPAVS